MSMTYIRVSYGVPAKRGCRIRYSPQGETPRDGVITGTRGAYLLVRMDGTRKSRAYHPTWCIEYLNGGVCKA